MLKAFLDDIACKFVVTQLYNPTFDAFYDAIFVFNVLALLKNVLDDIVTKLILGKHCDISKNKIDNWPSLTLLAVFQDSLDNSAAISMQAKLNDIFWMFTNWFHYEIYGIIRHFFYAFLDHMISILIINAIKNCVLEFLNQELLLIQWYNFESFLDNSAPIHRLCQLQNVTQ